jgi:hypothetical protein
LVPLRPDLPSVQQIQKLVLDGQAKQPLQI